MIIRDNISDFTFVSRQNKETDSFVNCFPEEAKEISRISFCKYVFAQVTDFCISLE